ncbi:MarR family winged helix-turn-helix transcriptional regulator [Nocardioides acrostichi]|uniref:MarR family transcriptional regulator n=1 Tax=Nocardioides acrostichi TaxID=2784339 RepID=A0A930UUX0_9ACTN|nr:MarR family transcriptional regulator [Nocardioides acrostichi]MBF4160077.1 MarR family transcriptional regulator [Nocardioides acrostichi]
MSNHTARHEELATELVVRAGRLVRSVRARGDLPPGHRVMAALEQHGSMGVSALALLDGCTQPTMSTAVAGLVERGWATKTTHPDDARSALVSLTDLGRATLREVRRRYGTEIAETLENSPHSLADLEVAVQVLTSLTSSTHDAPTDQKVMS